MLDPDRLCLWFLRLGLTLLFRSQTTLRHCSNKHTKIHTHSSGTSSSVPVRHHVGVITLVFNRCVAAVAAVSAVENSHVIVRHCQCSHAASSVFLCHGGEVTVVATHLFQHGGQFVEVSVGEVLHLPEIQDHAGRTGLGGEVVQIPWKWRGTECKVNVLHQKVLRHETTTISYMLVLDSVSCCFAWCCCVLSSCVFVWWCVFSLCYTVLYTGITHPAKINFKPTLSYNVQSSSLISKLEISS